MMRRVATERVPRRRCADRVGPRKAWEGRWEGEGGREGAPRRRHLPAQNDARSSSLRARGAEIALPDIRHCVRPPNSALPAHFSVATAIWTTRSSPPPLLLRRLGPFAARRRAALLASGLCGGGSRWRRWRRPAWRSCRCYALGRPAPPPPPSLRPPDAPSTCARRRASLRRPPRGARRRSTGAFVRYAVLTNRSGGGGELQPDAACATAALPSWHARAVGPSEAVLVRRGRVSTDGAGNASELVVARALPPQRPAAPTAARRRARAWTGLRGVALPPPAAAPPRYQLQVADATTQVADGDRRAAQLERAGADGRGGDGGLRHVVGLAAERAYCVRVRAANDVGASAWSEPIAVRTSAASATSRRGRRLRGGRRDGRPVELRWRPPADDGGSPVQGTASSCTARATPAAPTAAAWRRARRRRTNLSCTLGGLEASARTDCRVAARNSRGQSAWCPQRDGAHLGRRRSGRARNAVGASGVAARGGVGGGGGARAARWSSIRSSWTTGGTRRAARRRRGGRRTAAAPRRPT